MKKIPCAPEDLYPLLEKYYCVDRVLAHASVIYENDRWNRFSGYKKTADYVISQLKSCGADEVERISIPCDGKTKIGDWIVPLAWDAEDGILELIDDNGRRLGVLADYKAVPNSLIRWSRGTVAEGEILELLYLPDAFNEEAWKNARGKLVFTHDGPTGVVYGSAVRYGAAGIVTDYSLPPVEYVKEVQWWNTWTSLAVWGLTEQDTPLLGFSLSPEKGRELEKIICASKTPIRVRAKVKARIYRGTTDIVTAAIRGSEQPDREIVYYAHLYECQIDDNAVSAGMLLEMLRTVKELIVAGRMKPPKRTIRFVMGWEWIGSSYYAMHHKRAREWIASSCCDGSATKQKYTRQPLRLHMSPGFQASFADALFVHLWQKHFAARLETVACCVSPVWIGGTDTIWVDPTLGNVSNVWARQQTGVTWHKSRSTLEMIDRDVAKHSGLTSLTWALTIANADADDVERFCKLAADTVEHEIRKYAYSFNPAGDALSRMHRRLDADMEYLGQKAQTMIMSVSRLDGKAPGCANSYLKRIRGVLAEEKSRLEKFLDRREKTMSPRERQRLSAVELEGDELIAAGMVPKRLVRGGLWTQCRFSEDERRRFAELGYSQLWLFLCDGKRSVLDIAWIAEYDNRKKTDLCRMLSAFTMLAKAGYVEMKNRPRALRCGIKHQ